jgi:translocation and assembly module TamB
MSVQGWTRVSAETGLRSEIRLDGENFELARLPDLQFVASPSILVVFDDRVVTVTGKLGIPNADIHVREIPATAESVSPDAIVHRQESKAPSLVRRIDIDVRAELGDDVRLSGFGLETALDGAVQIRGGNQAVYTGQGQLSLREGRYRAYGQDLEIERGELIFNGPLEQPRLFVRAVRRINDVTAGIELTGTPSQLRSTTFSDPDMSDAETLSYLLTGRPLASATSTGEGDLLNNAAFALGMSGAGTIASQVRSQLGLETLTIEGGVDDSRLIAGKKFGNRLLVEYGYGLIDKLGTLLLRYQLTDRIVLESRTGTVSNLDVVYSVKKK